MSGAAFTATDGTRLDVTPVRFVRPVFDVVRYDGHNALAVAEWLANRAQGNPQHILDLRVTKEGLRLVQQDWSGGIFQVPAPSYIGLGAPPPQDDDDKTRHVLILDADAVKPALSLAGPGIERWNV